MEIGIGLPTAMRGTTLQQTLECARRAEAQGFASVGTIDRLVYGNHDPLIALAAVAAVTQRVHLVTAVLITPYRNTAVLAKQAATLDRMSDGRLVLGVGLGGRSDDYEAAGVQTRGRGARLTRQLTELKAIWAGETRGIAGAIGPEPARPGGPQLLVGGDSEPALQRMARVADGCVVRAGGPAVFAEQRPRIDAAWQRAGRHGRARAVGLAVYGLGRLAKEEGRRFLLDYYSYAGAHAERIASSMLVSVDAIRAAVMAFEAAGCDELLLFSASPDPGQVDLLAEAVRQPIMSGGR
jgi:alkanesulfonate monooxygenase SsuD/methylene tetrahydromethanopterin reductase-like flavin-dependent oxidoreductase (luciferase family)